MVYSVLEILSSSIACVRKLIFSTFHFQLRIWTDIVDFWWPPEANNGSNWRNQRFQNACSSVFFVEDVFTYGVDFQGRGVACSATLGIIIICDIPQYVITLQAVPCCFHDSIFHILFWMSLLEILQFIYVSYLISSWKTFGLYE